MPHDLPSSILYPRRILVRSVNWLGDAVMTTPALQRLSERFPVAHITLLTHEKLADLWLHHPSIDAVMTFRTGESPCPSLAASAPCTSPMATLNSSASRCAPNRVAWLG